MMSVWKILAGGVVIGAVIANNGIHSAEQILERWNEIQPEHQGDKALPLNFISVN